MSKKAILPILLILSLFVAHLSAQTTVPWNEAHKYYGKYATVEGTIVSTYNSGKACFLNFHQDYRKYFTAVIFRSDFHKFPASPEDYYLFKKVRVSGVIKDYKGKPEIILKNPNQIQIVGEREKPSEAQVISWMDADKYYGKYVTVQGRIVATYNSGKACFLNFHKNWRKYFTAVIFRSDFGKFPPNPEKYYKGKNVQVTGFVVEYKGKPEIIMKQPSQITILKEGSGKATSKPTSSQTQKNPASALARNQLYHQRYADDERELLKAILTLLGYPVSAGAGWDSLTDLAVRSFQTDKKLTPDGKIGPKTITTMRNSVDSITLLDQNTKAKAKLFLKILAHRQATRADRASSLTSKSRDYPASGRGYGYSSHKTSIQTWGEVEWYDYETGEYRYGDLESISGGEAEVYEWETGKYHYVDLDDAEVQGGGEVEWYDYETGEYRQGELESISGGEAEVYDWETGEYHPVDVGDIQ